MRLYAICDEIERIILDSTNKETGEIGEEALVALGSLEIAFKEKALDIAAYVLGEEAEAEAVHIRIEQMRRRMEIHKRRAEWLRKYLADNITPGTKIKDDRLELTWRRSEAVIIDDVEKLPDSCLRIVPEHKEPDKNVTRLLLKSGEKIDGAHLEVRHNLQIK